MMSDWIGSGTPTGVVESATFDPALGTPLDHIRLALGDHHSDSVAGPVTDPLLLDAVIQAKVDALGYVEALAQLAESLAARFAQQPDEYSESGGLRFKWSERVTQWLELARRARSGQISIPGQARVYRPGAAVQRTTVQATLTSSAAGSQFRSD